MKNRKLLIVFSFLCIMLFNSIAYGEAKNNIYRYLDIPYEAATPEMLAKIIGDQKGVSLEISSKVWSGYASGISEFGYHFDLQYDFNEQYFGTHRIQLSSSQPTRFSTGEWERVQGDLLQFLDMEAQLNELYGEPDCRFFRTIKTSDDRKNYMFEEGQWSLENMMQVCESNLYLKAYSVWDNVVLLSWVDLQKPVASGKYSSRIMLTYYPDLKATSSMIHSSVVPYTLTP